MHADDVFDTYTIFPFYFNNWTEKAENIQEKIWQALLSFILVTTNTSTKYRLYTVFSDTKEKQHTSQAPVSLVVLGELLSVKPRRTMWENSRETANHGMHNMLIMECLTGKIPNKVGMTLLNHLNHLHVTTKPKW
jgi:hypothetical protein